MAAKDRATRWRYIAFCVEAEGRLARNDFLGALLKAARSTNLQDSFRITVYEEGFGILKVPHRFKEDAISVLGSLSEVRGARVKVTTLRTSGTIKTLKGRYARFISTNDRRSE